MLTDAELREIRDRWEPKVLDGFAWPPPGVAAITADPEQAVFDVPRLLDEIERLRGALVAVDDAECCGCGIYGEIARAALDGQEIFLDTYYGKTTSVSAEVFAQLHKTPDPA